MNIEDAKLIIAFMEKLPPKTRGTRGFLAAAEHDVVYLDIDPDEVPEELKPELDKLVGFDSSVDSYYVFV